MNRPSHRNVALVLCLGTVLLLACRTAPIMNVAVPIDPQSRAGIDQIGKAVVAAGKSLGWVIAIEQPGQAVGTLQLRKHEAVVNIEYSQTVLRIDYVSSRNLLQKGDKIHRNYNNWINNLKNRILERIGELS